MKRILIYILLLLFVCGCSNANNKIGLTDEVKNIISEGNYQIIDVRTNEEYESGHIIDAINIPYETIGENIDIDKDIVVLVYCQSGRRSNIAFTTLSKLGYKVYDLGGYDTIDLPKE